MPLLFAELEVWDENNKPVPLGEIVARTDGWMKTGGIERLDANGYLYRLDRADDMVISSGFSIYPAEPENVIEARPRSSRSRRSASPIRNGARRRARRCA
jgi:acyl-CoA synthetase (AMP-forming)/AMP-acid ligase II